MDTLDRGAELRETAIIKLTAAMQEACANCPLRACLPTRSGSPVEQCPMRHLATALARIVNGHLEYDPRYEPFESKAIQDVTMALRGLWR